MSEAYAALWWLLVGLALTAASWVRNHTDAIGRWSASPSPTSSKTVPKASAFTYAISAITASSNF